MNCWWVVLGMGGVLVRFEDSPAPYFRSGRFDCGDFADGPHPASKTRPPSPGGRRGGTWTLRAFGGFAFEEEVEVGVDFSVEEEAHAEADDAGDGEAGHAEA